MSCHSFTALNQFVRRDRKFTHAFPAGMESRICHCCRRTDDPYLTDAASAQIWHMRVGLVDEVHLELGYVRANGHVILRQICVQISTDELIWNCRFHQRHPETESHPADDLATGKAGSENATHVVNADRTSDSRLSEGIDIYLDEDGAERWEREFLAIFLVRFRL